MRCPITHEDITTESLVIKFTENNTIYCLYDLETLNNVKNTMGRCPYNNKEGAFEYISVSALPQDIQNEITADQSGDQEADSKTKIAALTGLKWTEDKFAKPVRTRSEEIGDVLERIREENDNARRFAAHQLARAEGVPALNNPLRGLNPFSKNSGTMYLKAYYSPTLQGKEMKDETLSDAFLKHRFFKDTVDRTIIHTFNLIVGSHYDVFFMGSGQKGLLDMLVFPLISRKIFNKLNYQKILILNENREMTLSEKALQTIGRAVAVTLEMLRFAIGLGMTALLTPVVLAADFTATLTMGIAQACGYTKPGEFAPGVTLL